MQLDPPDQMNGSWYSSAAPEKEKHVYTGAGEVHYLAVENQSAATVYAFVYDGADHTGTLLHAPIPIPSHGVGGFDARYGIPFNKGLYVGLSTTDSVWTADAAADGWITAGYSPVPGGG